MIEGAKEKVGRSEVKIKRLKEPETLPFGIQIGRKLGTLFNRKETGLDAE
jgi:hypothetical protein